MKGKQTKLLEKLLKNTGDMCLKRRARKLITELNLQNSDRILDAGCGDGYYLYLLSRLGKFNLTGIDYLDKNIKDAKRQVNNTTIRYFTGNIQNMPFKSGSFNKIILSEVLEHVQDDYLALKELSRVLDKNGKLYVTVPHINYPFFWDPINYLLQRIFKIHIKSGFWAGVWNMHDRLYSVPELKNVIHRAGFKIELLECLTHYGIPFNHYLTNIGFRVRTSNKFPEYIKQTMTKFSYSPKKTWFYYILKLINWFDRRNDRHFSDLSSTVGIFVIASKQ